MQRRAERDPWLVARVGPSQGCGASRPRVFCEWGLTLKARTALRELADLEVLDGGAAWLDIASDK